MQLVILILVLKLNFFGMDCNEYKIISYQEAGEILKKEKKSFADFDDQLDTNFAFVYKLRKGKILLHHGTKEAILFDHIDCFKQMVEKDQYPIKDEIESPFQLTSNELLQKPETTIKLYQDELLDNYLSITVEDTCDEDLLESLAIKIKLSISQKMDESDRFDEVKLSYLAALYFAKKANKLHGHSLAVFLCVEKVYSGYNKYYKPRVVISYRGEYKAIWIAETVGSYLYEYNNPFIEELEHPLSIDISKEFFESDFIIFDVDIG